RPPLYTVWEEFTGWTMDHTAKIPKSQRFTFGQRIDGRTLDVLELIVQCIYRTDRTTGLHRINLELEVLRVLWRVVQKRGWLSLNQLDYAQARIDAFHGCGTCSRP
ncbi:MAG: four helix bundle protein, partial [Lentisphaerae bacterium]|nr:four helix bundle protein [Lentisphaerota bacterium]